MKPWTRRHTLIAGIALIALTNAVALLGVAWNRSGEPDSVLALSQRELHRPYWRRNSENSGIALALRWRVAPVPPRDATDWAYAGAGGAPAWLDRAKMESLGFTLPAAGEEDDYERRRRREQSRDVLLVLELDGPAHREIVERVGRHAEAEDALLAASPDNAEFQRRAKSAHERLKQEQDENSRLFVVDAGLERAALRAAYPDRSRYAIVGGRIAPWYGSPKDIPRGYVHKVHIDAINVPFAWRQAFETADGRRRATADIAPFQATIAFGRRLEPWIAALSIAAD